MLEKDREIKITNVDAELYGSDHGNLAHIANSDRYNFVKANISNKIRRMLYISKNYTTGTGNFRCIRLFG